MADEHQRALEAARRIVAANDMPSRRPTVAELEAILASPEPAVPIHINPDGSIGAGPNDALTVARALLAASPSVRDAALVEALGVALDGLQRLASPTKFEPADMPHIEFVTRRVFAEKTLEVARALSPGGDSSLSPHQTDI